MLCFFGANKIIILFLSSCASYVKEKNSSELSDSVRTIYVVSHGWHTGIVVQKANIPYSLWPGRLDFPNATYLEVGWGEKDFYQNPDFNLFEAIKAALWPTASALHVVGFSERVEDYFPLSEIIQITLPVDGFKRLCAFINESFALDSLGHGIPLGQGIYGNSQFYLGKSKYYFPHTCNVWTARALKKAGYPITPLFCQTAGSVMIRARKFGKVVRTPESHQQY